MRIFKYLLLSIALLCPIVGQALIIHVPADQPTIADGVAAASQGDTVLVAAGTYVFSSSIYTETKGFTLLADGEVTLDGANTTGFLSFGADWVTTGTTLVEGFRFIDNQGTAVDVDGEYTLHLKDCRFETGTAATSVAANIAVIGCELLVENCYFTHNLGGLAGAVACSAAASQIIGCEFYFNEAYHGAGAVHLDTSMGDYEIRDCVFVGNSGPEAVVMTEYGSSSLISGCTFVESYIHADGAVLLAGINSEMTVENCIVAFNSQAEAFACREGGTIDIHCTDSHANSGGDWTDCAASFAGINGNISEDPLFCDPGDFDFTLYNISPCAAENNSCGVLMGALGVNCSSTAVESTDWGRMKSLY